MNVNSTMFIVTSDLSSIVSEESLRVGIIGTGYVGLVSGVCFADLGFKVICGDVIPEKVDMINNGIPPIFENGLEDLLKSLRSRNMIEATLDTNYVVDNSDIIFVCTGTPSNDDGNIDLKYIKAAAESIGTALKRSNDYKTIVVKSTVVPGTTTNFVKPILEEKSEKRVGLDFGLGMNPEFLKEGLAIKDFKYPDHIVIGAVDEKSHKMINQLYTSFTCPIQNVEPSTAEMIKYATNAFLALKVSFINEIANMAEKMGVDVDEVSKGIGADKRISPQFLRPGVGFGGSCFPKDVKALAHAAKVNGVTATMLDAAIEVNRHQPKRAVELLSELIEIKGAKIGLLGMAFKPETDDMRQAPSITIANELISRGATVVGYDPIANQTAKQFMPSETIHVDNAKSVLQNADGVILVTEWNEFNNLTLDDFKLMKGNAIVDGRRILDWKNLQNNGFKIRVLGNKSN